MNVRIRALIAAVLMILSGAPAFAQLSLNSQSDTAPGLSQSLVQVGSGALTLTLRGSGFSPNSVARFGSTNLATVYGDAHTLTATIPSSLLRSTGAVGVSLIDGAGTSNSIPLMVTQRGDFNGNGAVNIGDALVLALTVGELLKPPITAAAGDLNLNGNANISDALVLALFTGGLQTNLATPAIASASVSGQSITLTGTGFSLAPENNIVVFPKTGGGYVTAAAATVTEGTGNRTLALTIPTGAVSGPVFVKRADLGLPGQPFVVGIASAPVPLYLSRVTPAAGLSAGTAMSLAGSGFDSTASNNRVIFSAAAGTTVSAVPSTATPTSMTVTVPDGVVSGYVSVTTNNQTSNQKSILTGAAAPLRINHVYNTDIEGEPILIEGTGFNVSSLSDNQVLFNDTPATVISAGRTELVVIVPAGTTTATLKVRTTGGTVTSNSWDYSITGVTAPSITSIVFLDPVAEAVASEIIVNEGNSVQTRLRITDSLGVTRSQAAQSYLSINPEVAAVDSSGNIQGRRAGFSTLTATAGGAVATATITVVAVSAPVSSEAFDVAVDGANRIYTTSSQTHTVQLSLLGQTPTIYAGVNQTPGLANGLRLQSTFKGPSFVAFDHASGALYVADSLNHVIRRVAAGAGGKVETLAGTGSAGSEDGPVAAARFNNPRGVALDNRGNLWVVDSGNQTIRRIDLLNGIVSTIAGLAGSPGSADGTGNQARFNSPSGIALEEETFAQEQDRFYTKRAPPSVRMLVADTGNGRLRRVKETGEVATIGSTASDLQVSDNLNAPAASSDAALGFSSPAGVAIDSSGSIYLTEPGTGALKTILPNGTVVSGAQAGTFASPRGIAIAGDGKLVVADGAQSARQIAFGSPTVTNVTPDTINGTGGQTITVSGTNFSPDSVVVVGGVVISGPTVVNTQLISFPAPSLPSGINTLTVLNRGGVGQSAFKITPPALTGLAPGFITTVVGGQNFEGDGGPASKATLENPAQMALDSRGNIYIADFYTSKVRRIDARTRVMNTIAGGGTESGDGGLALAAGFGGLSGIAIDRAGSSIYLSFSNNIKKIDAATGIIRTIAGGTSGSGFSGDGGQAAAASFYSIPAMRVGPDGDLYVVDEGNHRIRKISLATGIVTTVAGSGPALAVPGDFSGDGGLATSAHLNFPHDVAFDSSGNMLIADGQNYRIRKVDRQTQIITTVAGNGTHSSSQGDGGPAISASLEKTDYITADLEGGFYISTKLRHVDANGIITDAVCDSSGNNCAVLLPSGLNIASGLAVDSGGNLYAGISDYLSAQIFVRSSSGVFSAVNSPGGTLADVRDGGLGVFANLKNPRGVAFDSNGNLVLSDQSHQRIRRVAAATGVISSVVSNTDGVIGITSDRNGNVYYTEFGTSSVKKIDANGAVQTISGMGHEGFAGDDGPATAALLRHPFGVALDANGDFYIADTDNHRIRKVSAATGNITTVAGNGSAGFSGDGGLATQAALNTPWGVALDLQGNLLIADKENYRIRKVDRASGIITTLAGATNPFNAFAMAIDSSGNVYIGSDGQILRRSATTGIISRIAGGGSGGDGVTATGTRLTDVTGLTFDAAGNLYLSEMQGNRVRVIKAPIP